MQRLPQGHDEHDRQSDRRSEWQVPPLADVEEHGDQQWRQRCAQTEQHVEGGERNLPTLRLECPGVGADRSQRQSEAETEAPRHHQQQRERHRVGAHAVADDEQRHRHAVGGETDEEHPLESDAPGNRRQRQRPGDGEDHLRQEEQPILTGGQVVAVGTGEDRGGSGHGDETESLEQSSRVHGDDLRPAWSSRVHATPLELARWAALDIYDGTTPLVVIRSG